ncbi:MAG: nucleotidyl transferase AbiEii/AbiGii toxin family protein [Deltaproteobacteria bacterium]|nr:nucleotidyl transferase AbiEii/AbiGii toxin family protein [Deltaproteobacteria bacterium]
MEILTDFQEEILRKISETELKDIFCLTEGTALSAFYLRHRLSEDLDFFTEVPDAVSRVLPVLERIAADLSAKVVVRCEFRTFLEAHIEAGPEIVRIDFALDSPYRLEPVRRFPPWDVAVDNPTDIACNKLSALFDRADPKDFIDVFFIDREILPLPRLIGIARKKHVGMDDYWLAVAFSKAATLSILPRMIRPVTVEELQFFFAAAANRLLEGIGKA